MLYVNMLSLQSNGSYVLTQDRVQFIADNEFFFFLLLITERVICSHFMTLFVRKDMIALFCHDNSVLCALSLKAS